MFEDNPETPPYHREHSDERRPIPITRVVNGHTKDCLGWRNVHAFEIREEIMNEIGGIGNPILGSGNVDDLLDVVFFLQVGIGKRPIRHHLVVPLRQHIFQKLRKLRLGVLLSDGLGIVQGQIQVVIECAIGILPRQRSAPIGGLVASRHDKKVIRGILVDPIRGTVRFPDIDDEVLDDDRIMVAHYEELRCRHDEDGLAAWVASDVDVSGRLVGGLNWTREDSLIPSKEDLDPEGHVGIRVCRHVGWVNPDCRPVDGRDVGLHCEVPSIEWEALPSRGKEEAQILVIPRDECLGISLHAVGGSIFRFRVDADGRGKENDRSTDESYQNSRKNPSLSRFPFASGQSRAGYKRESNLKTSPDTRSRCIVSSLELSPASARAEGWRVADKVPETLITDGLPSYHLAWSKVYNQRKWSDMTPTHIREISLEGTVHNNKMERMNGEVRDRERVMRGLKNTDTAIVKGLQIYHNFIRPHEALKGDTPADRAGIKVEGSNKWLTIIQNAAKGDRK
jgi:hypothetical protein